jgi:hypothetical protein
MAWLIDVDTGECQVMMQKGQNVHEIIRQAATNGYQYPAGALVTLG